MSALRLFFVVSGVGTIVYFAAINTIYLVFTLMAWRSLSTSVSRHTYGAIEEAFESPFIPGITVIVPAYNESAGIVESVKSLIGLHYPLHEIVVVNDGSTDETLDRLRVGFDLVPAHRAMRGAAACRPVRQTYVSRQNHDLWVLDKENGGKADALNAGVNAARHPYICAVDADTIIEPDALLDVAAPILEDPEVVATGGIVRIANGCTIDHGRVVDVRLPTSRLAVLQVLEYFRAFLVGRVGWTQFNTLLIISGAFGLFRREVVEEVGGYWTETVCEDMELVVRMHRHLHSRGAPYRIAFVPDPVCWTEVPEDLRTLSGQRRRWQRGLGQTLWRHRGATANPRCGTLGLLGMPYFVIFEFLGPVIEILGPPVTLVALLLGYLSLLFFLALLAVAYLLGIALTVAALALEEFNFRRYRQGRDILRLLAYAIVENIGYRQLNDLWRMLAVVDLLRRRTSWGAQRRRGIGRVVTGRTRKSAHSGARPT